jgi:hypothetical protein
MPLYPTEEIIWNESIVPTEYFSGEGCLALPKLNLQFLTLHDYLLRNFNLFRLESTCTCDAILGRLPLRALPPSVDSGKSIIVAAFSGRRIFRLARPFHFRVFISVMTTPSLLLPTLLAITLIATDCFFFLRIIKLRRDYI